MKKVFKVIAILCLVSLLAVLTLGCVRALSLAVWEPNDGTIVTNPQIYVKGKVSDTKASVTVNNTATWRNKKTGEFQGKVYLVEGENKIEIVAQRNNKVESKLLIIIYQPE